jgi:hypothetical protein
MCKQLTSTKRKSPLPKDRAKKLAVINRRNERRNKQLQRRNTWNLI